MLLPQPLRASSPHTHRRSFALAHVALLCFVARLLAHVSRLVAALRSVVPSQPVAALRPVVSGGLSANGGLAAGGGLRPMAALRACAVCAQLHGPCCSAVGGLAAGVAALQPMAALQPVVES